jgi:hypothetical protein
MRGLMVVFLGILKFPLWLLSRLFGRRRRKVREEMKEKQRKYVRNFSLGRLKNVSWQKSVGKNERKKNIFPKN